MPALNPAWRIPGIRRRDFFVLCGSQQEMLARNAILNAWPGYAEAFGGYSFPQSMGNLAYEQLCMTHVPQTKHKLDIGGILSEESVWSTSRNKEPGIPGAQIGLYTDRMDKTVNLCEIQFAEDEYIIGKDDEFALRNKRIEFRELTKCRKSIQMTMLTTYGVKKNMYSGIVQNQVLMDDLFCKE